MNSAIMKQLRSHVTWSSAFCMWQYVEDALAQMRQMIVGLGAQNNQGARQANQFSRLAKVKFPKFNGDDVLGWIFKCDKFFLIDNTLEEEKVKIIYVHLFDKALLWHRQLIKTKGENISWTDYKDVIALRFGSVYDDPMALLKNAKYDKSAKEYPDTFDTLLSRVKVSEEYAISLYLGGLPTEVEMCVRMFRPNTLFDAYCLTTLQEATLEALALLPPNLHQDYENNSLKGVEEKRQKNLMQEEFLDADDSLVDTVNERVQAHISLNALSGSVPGGKHMVTRVVIWGTTKSVTHWLDARRKIEKVENKKNAELMMMSVYPNTGLQLMNMFESVASNSKVEPRLHEITDAYDEVFAVPTKLPPIRSQDHRITLMPGTQPQEFGRSYSTSLNVVVYNEKAQFVYQRERFIKDFASISRPLTQLLKKNSFQWSNEAQQAFTYLKNAMVQAPALALPNFNKPFVVETYAYGVGLGAILQQEGHPIAYMSKTLAPRHQALSTYEKEFLAVLMALEKWRGYLLDRHFVIKTHQS
ncbi:reverse transcriptase [Tanacetum coccineum]|uniref:Reverse transcriptase n=1 Tax=Tanacetum coccineum TaxID=301880 RepID=A0ABQ4ZRU8_9ASTR